MKRHVWRPLYVVIGLVLFILLVRDIYVPSDFQVGEKGYMYGYHRLGNEQEWKDFTVKYRGREYCAECHDENTESMLQSPHVNIQCENCHGAPFGHGEEHFEPLTIDLSRDLCLRCHAALYMPTSDRNKLQEIDPMGHNVDMACVDCHNPHHPNLEDM